MYTNILLPVLFDKNHDAQGTFEIAKALAAEGAKFSVIHVLEPVPGYARAEIPDHILANRQKETEDELAQIAGTLPNASATLVSGHAGRAIVRYAADHGIDCIVLESHKPGLENFFLGSTADRVVRHAKCAVHVVR